MQTNSPKHHAAPPRDSSALTKAPHGSPTAPGEPTTPLSPPHLARLLGPPEPTEADSSQAAADDAAAAAACACAAEFAGAAPPGAQCYICLSGGELGHPLVRSCACRGMAGYAHVACLAAQARSARTFEAWQACGVCKSAYQGSTALALATAAWAEYVCLEEHEDKRLSAQVEVAGQLLAARNFEEARPKLEACLQTCARVGDDARALVVTANLATAYHFEGRVEDALQLERAVFREQHRLRGPTHPETLFAASNLAGLLLAANQPDKALRLLKNARRHAFDLKRDSDVALRLTHNLALALCATTGHLAEAEALAEENLVLQTRVYGAGHPNAAVARELVGHVRRSLAALAVVG